MLWWKKPDKEEKVLIALNYTRVIQKITSVVLYRGSAFSMTLVVA